jgi:iron complex transport system substrate-binding protein
VIVALLAAAALAAGSPQRVVSLAPSLTDIVLGLGAQERLVGVSRFDDDARVKGLPRVGGLLDPNLEAVVQLHPDLVLALDGAVEAPTLGALRRAGLNVLALRHDALPQVFASVRAVAAALGQPEAGERMQARLEAQLGAVRARARGQRALRVALVIGWRPLVLAGRGSYLEPLLEAAGGVNVAASALAWPTSSMEALLAAPPEVVVDGAPGEVDAEALRLRELLEAHGSRVARLPSGDLFRPGPRAVEALPELEAALRGK